MRWFKSFVNCRCNRANGTRVQAADFEPASGANGEAAVGAPGL